MTSHTCENGVKTDNSQKVWKLLNLVLTDMLFTAYRRLPTLCISFCFGWLVRVPTEAFEGYQKRSNAGRFISFVTTNQTKQYILRFTRYSLAIQYYSWDHESVYTLARNELALTDKY